MMDHYAADVEPDPAEFPNTIKRRRTSTAHPDGTSSTEDMGAMGRGQASAAGNESVAGDVDTCRICRGEGTTGEPLFYPCKCSGSIKYVHQDCLMEWLSHSQKKHCELCKTPFRFTKLYSPNMPKRLPFYVFASHIAKYLFRNVLVWLRALLVVSVWLGWLPYLMRSVWSFLFWISDEGFGPAAQPFSSANQAATAAHLNLMASTVASQGVTTTICPASPLYPATTTSPDRQHIVEHMPNFLQALGPPLKLNMTNSNSFAISLARMIFGGALLSPEDAAQMSLNATTAGTMSSLRHETLLSEVHFLKNLTSQPAVNRIVIQILEGQIITLLVIICFILIILVRDYVVQQQPEINMRAAFAAQMNNAEEPQEQPQQHLVPAEAPPRPRQVLRAGNLVMEEEDVRDDDSIVAHDGDATDYMQPTDRRFAEAALEPQQRPIAGFRRRLARRDTQEDGINRPASPAESAPLAPPGERMEAARETTVPGTPDDQSQTTVNQYLRIYREANGDREKILRMIHDEGLEDRLAYWVNVTQSMAKTNNTTSDSSSTGANHATISEAGTSTDSHRMDWSPTWPGRESATRRLSEFSALDGPWGPAPQLPVESWDSPAAGGKGKQRATERTMEGGSASAVVGATPPGPVGLETQAEEAARDHGNAAEDVAPASHLSPSRPRATSDGPPVHDKINPLANNSWSFADLPPTASDPEHPLPLHLPQQVPTDSSSDVIYTPQDSHAGADSTADMDPWVDVDEADQDPEPTPEAPVYGELAPEPALPRQPATLVGRVADFMWGDLDAPLDGAAPDAMELFIDDQNAPFMNANRDHNDDEGDEQDDADGVIADDIAPEVVEAAAAAGIDQEAIDDAEDFDGIMELIGMRGPIAGLFQNAIFCAFLVSFTILVGIFLPYNIGRLSVWVVANPMRIIRMVFSFSKFVQDVCLFAVGWTMSTVFNLLYVMSKLFEVDTAQHFLETALTDAQSLTVESMNRLWDSIMFETAFITSNEIRNFSIVSHEALITVKHHFWLLLSLCGRAIAFIFGGDYVTKWEISRAAVTAAVPSALDTVKDIMVGISHPGSWMINLHLPETTTTFDPVLAYWNAKDRTLAILGGYLSVSVIAGLYLGRGTPFSSGRTAQEWEASFIDALNQASGVMKVILIISIEMLVFPLYCGLLLDFALLPLFESTTLRSRLLFTYNYPLTSIFVHWFVGTGYMFHFALFVSMCRKIMRKGVLCKSRPSSHTEGPLLTVVDFIRDPDDPEFHPVRDVLERSVTTQLRKILFSAFVYGALVVVCLGGVVWSLSLALPSVLPIHYSSNEPVLEFPIDLLFYNFLMPLAVKFFKPSDGLHAMYTWWFRRCARMLRLTWFLFGERRVDEEGILQLAVDSEDAALPWYRRLLLQVEDDQKVVPRTFPEAFDSGEIKPTAKMTPEEMHTLNAAKAKLVDSDQLIPDGRFVRAPASDQVKIPKGRPVFLEVSDRDSRIDGKIDRPETDLYSGKNYQFVYVPPWFRVRIFLFILFIWLFAAVTGVSFTIVPLIFGRRMFKVLIPTHIRTNDIYAFSIGIYILGSLAYFLFHLRSALEKARSWMLSSAGSLFDRELLQKSYSVARQGVQLCYTYMMLLVVFPLLATLVIELYVLLPLHTWKYSNALNHPDEKIVGRFDGLRDGHTIRVIQAWTLGLLYLKLGSRCLVMLGGRPAHAVRAVLRQGWLEPDVGVLTRAFVIPGFLLSALLIASPAGLTHLFISRGIIDASDWTREQQVLAFRMSYPITAFCWINLWILRGMLHVLDRWRARVRDEAYLMGERLHNFGGMVGTRGTSAGNRGEWRGGARL
jgi:E3 ubiquitin-protein ligase MARCH6